MATREQLVSPADFLREDPPERIIGPETEFDVRDGAGEELTDEDWQGCLLDAKVLEACGLQVLTSDDYHFWFSNGAMAYPDAAHLEIAGAESYGPIEAAAQGHANAGMLGMLVLQSHAPFQVFRRSATVNPRTGSISTKGAHWSFSLPHYANHASNNLNLLEPHLASVGVFASGGIVTPRGFNISPKSHDIGRGLIRNSLASRTTPGNKPMGIVRGAHVDTDTNAPVHGFDRLEVRTATPSSEWSDMMFTGTTSVLLRIFEHRGMLAAEKQRLAGLRLNDHSLAFKLIAGDVGLKRTVGLANGRRMNGVDLQEAHAEIADSVNEKLQLPASEQLVVAHWKWIVEQLRATQRDNDYRRLARHIGWASKYVYFAKKYGEGYLLPPGRNPHPVNQMARILGACLNWDRVAPKGASQVFAEKRNAGYIDSGEQEYGSLLPKGMIDQLITSPPQRTRARVRGDFVQDSDNLRNVRGEQVQISSMQWPGVQFDGARMATLHPYQTRRPTLRPVPTDTQPEQVL